jgi:hypothetical protein
MPAFRHRISLPAAIAVGDAVIGDEVGGHVGRPEALEDYVERGHHARPQP